MEVVTIIIIAAAVVVSLLSGLIVGRIITKKSVQGQEDRARKEAGKIINEAKQRTETIKKEKELQAKERFMQLKGEHEKKIGESNKKIQQRENSLKQKENQLSQQRAQLNRKEKEADQIKENLGKQLEVVELKKKDLDRQVKEAITQLESAASMTAQQARDELIKNMKDEAQNQAMAHIKDVMNEAKLKANKEAKKIIIQTIQRTASEHTIENTVSVFNLKNDDQKGQIIGREGRNIRALEAATGVELVVDDTPEAILISGYDPVRREIARLSLQRLVTDGRIHPARIEEVVRKTAKQLEDHIIEIGERTVIELGVQGLHAQLIRMVGRMRFRSSYGQNLLQHSKETANLCATMAAELGLSPKLCKRAGLLHDIGKVPDEDSELTHALLGMKLCEKYGEHKAVCNAVGAHHDEIEMTYIISPIVQACDAISGARPGARRETMENYMKRIKELENVALGYEGVEKAYAIQAGRELRVIVESEKVDDKKAEEISFKISEKIMSDMQYPGQIKVTVIRETRAVAFAK